MVEGAGKVGAALTAMGHANPFFERAGFAIFGKTTTPEYGLTATTETLLSGATKNPYDITKSSGGSSGGAA